MAVETGGDGRVRAWVLVQAGDPEKVAERLYKKFGHEGGDEYVVVRADVVDYSHNVVIPVDAASEEKLVSVVDMVEDVRGVETATVVRVTMSFPYPPHISHGYITEAELEAVPELVARAERLVAGRQGASPGHNPWG